MRSVALGLAVAGLLLSADTASATYPRYGGYRGYYRPYYRGGYLPSPYPYIPPIRPLPVPYIPPVTPVYPVVPVNPIYPPYVPPYYPPYTPPYYPYGPFYGSRTPPPRTATAPANRTPPPLPAGLGFTTPVR
ncbi:MAG: hypothetical protein K2X82_27365 [Gemmataceae bacterium]|nr:hypothetical protein [Gemmataceae bacterium]